MFKCVYPLPATRVTGIVEGSYYIDVSWEAIHLISPINAALIYYLSKELNKVSRIPVSSSFAEKQHTSSTEEQFCGIIFIRFCHDIVLQ